jgi:uncharacterized protein with PQ loop repeat
MLFKGIHHLHLRKRIHVLKTPYPHPNKWKRILDHTAYFIGFFGILMTIPQAWTVWVEGQVAGISLMAWGWYTISALFWLLYGIAHKEFAIIFSNIGFCLLDMIIVIGVILQT